MRILLHTFMAASLVSVGSPALASPEAGGQAVIEERVYVETTVDSDHNGRPDRVAIDIARTSGATSLPVVFEHSPYREGLNNWPNHNINVDHLPQEDIFGATPSDDGAMSARSAPNLPGWYDDYFLPRGYAVVLGYSIGTGPSDGCPTSGDMQETLGTTAVIDWLNGRARGFNSSGEEVLASWANGNVGMIGISYNGTLPNMAAATGVEGLKAIVPISAISSWYDYYRANGLVVAPGGYQGEDADVLAHAVVGNSGCDDEMDAIEAAQDRITGDYTQFWRDRDYVKDAGNVTAAVFVIHGQADWNVKGMHYAQWYQALRERDAPRKIWLHRGGHGTASRSDYRSTVGRWFDRYVKDIDNGIDREPKADVQYGDGTWRTYADWPDPAISNAVFHLGATTATAPGTLSLNPTTGNVDQSFIDQGRTTSAGTLVSNPDSADGNRLIYLSAPLTFTIRLSGVPAVSLRAAVDNRDDANLTALLVDYSGSSPTIVTRGWMDPQNRNGHTGEPLVRGQEYDMSLRMQPRDYFFEAGHRIGLVVISTDYDYTLRPLGGSQLHLDPGLSTLTLPMVGDVDDPSPGGCDGYESTFTGTLGSGASEYQPDGSWFYTGDSGIHEACLDGPDSTDFDLYLQKANASAPIDSGRHPISSYLPVGNILFTPGAAMRTTARRGLSAVVTSAIVLGLLSSPAPAAAGADFYTPPSPLPAGDDGEEPVSGLRGFVIAAVVPPGRAGQVPAVDYKIADKHVCDSRCGHLDRAQSHHVMRRPPVPRHDGLTGFAVESLRPVAGHEVALPVDLGYSDQAHFTRDFTSIVGVSPRRYAKAQ